MSKTTPFIGSKISLISKAEIRYEGTLYQVDADNSTVTLAKVRSFGTEGRPTAKQIQPRNDVYEFIIFRGNDIKDLNVSEMPGQQAENPIPPQDPAILSAQSYAPGSVVPASSSMVSHSPGPPAHPASHHTVPPAHGVPSQATLPYYTRPPTHSYSHAFGLPYFRPPMVMGAGVARHPQPPSMPPVGVSPQPPSRDSPQAPIGSSLTQGHLVAVVPPHGTTQVDVSPDQAPISSSFNVGPVVTPTVVPTSMENMENKPQASSTPLVAASESDSPLQPLMVTVSAANPVIPLDHDPPVAPTHSTAVAPPTSAAMQQHQSRVPSAQQAAHRSTSLRGSGEAQSRRPGSGRQGAAAEGRGSKKVFRPHGKNQGGGASHGSRYAGGGNPQYTGGGGGGYQRGRRDNQYYRGGRENGGGGGRRGDGRQNQDRQQVDRTSFKYDSEFDFESANARFKKEDLELEFKQLRLDDRASKMSDGSSRKASVGSGHDLNESSDEEVEIIDDGVSVEDEAEGCYDKSKSFFDNISCETNTVSTRRPTRNEEREVNTETFGVSSVNSNYGYYRYRRNWRGRGRGDFRGGRGGDFRGGRGGRGRYRNADGGQYNKRGGGAGERGQGRGGRGRGSYRNNYESYQPNPI